MKDKSNYFQSKVRELPVWHVRVRLCIFSSNLAGLVNSLFNSSLYTLIFYYHTKLWISKTSNKCQIVIIMCWIDSLSQTTIVKRGFLHIYLLVLVWMKTVSKQYHIAKGENPMFGEMYNILGIIMLYLCYYIFK